jgi:hypothetical protein
VLVTVQGYAHLFFKWTASLCVLAEDPLVLSTLQFFLQIQVEIFVD